MDRSVNFLMSGPGHLPYLAVALDTLRRHFDGRVVVHAYPESFPIVSEMAKDPRLRIEPRLWIPDYDGKNGQFLNKIRMMQRIDTDQAVYLDADVVIDAPLDPLFNRLEKSEFVATQFCKWFGNVGTVANRVRRLMDREGVEQEFVNRVLAEKHPSVNGGVFAVNRGAYFLQEWEQWTLAVIDIFIADETVLHPLVLKHGSEVMLGGAWNCSPKHKPLDLKTRDVVIWHGHGDCFVRGDKAPFGEAMWIPLFDSVLQRNIGRIQEWISKIDYPYLKGSKRVQDCLQRRSVPEVA